MTPIGCVLCADIRQAVFTVNHHLEAEPHCGKCGREIPVVRVAAEDYQERVAPFAHLRTPPHQREEPMSPSTNGRIARLEKTVAVLVRTCANDHKQFDFISAYATPADVEAQKDKPYPTEPGDSANACPMCGLALVSVRFIRDLPREEAQP